MIERICSEAISQANRRIYATLSENLSPAQRHSLDGLLKLRADKTITTMAWLQQSPAASTGRHILTHIDRLKALRAIGLPDQIESAVHRNRLLKIAREGAQMTSRNLAKFEPERRHATLAAMVIETTATITDELIDLHDRSLIAVFNRAKHKHQNEFTRSGKAINEKMRLYWRIGSALMQAKQSGADPFAAIETVLPWEALIVSVTEAEKLGQAEAFDYLRYIGDSYLAMRRYTPELLDVLDLRAAPAAQDVLDAVNVLRAMNAGGQRVVPKDAPTGFVRKRWESLVVTDGSVDRRFYELCALSELKNALRSGDIWVRGSRQFKDFDEYLLPAKQFSQLKEVRSLSLPIEIDGDRYIHDRLDLNVGAGTGSYEPTDRDVTAVEPSAGMRGRRPIDRPAIEAVVERLPFADASFEAAMTTFSIHQWRDMRAGLAEMRRVTRGQILILTCDPDALDRFWLSDYCPEVIAVEARRYPPIDEIAKALGGNVDVVTVPIPLRCTDGFQEAYYGRPQAFLDPGARRACSAWSFVPAPAITRFVTILSTDLKSGAWDAAHGTLREQPMFDGSLRLIVEHP